MFQNTAHTVLLNIWLTKYVVMWGFSLLVFLAKHEKQFEQYEISAYKVYLFFMLHGQIDFG